VPKRTNTFQQAVRIIHEHLAEEGATVEESDMLIDSMTGEEREVDVTLTRTVATYSVVVSVEASASKRPAEVGWVEQLLKKHESLPTSKLILVSEAGFSEAARKKAIASKAVPLAPEDLTEDDPALTIVNRLGSVASKTFAMTPEKFAIWVRAPEGVVKAEIPNDEIAVVASDGTFLSVLRDEIPKRLAEDPEQVAREIRLPDVPRSVEMEFSMNIRGWEVEITRADGSTEVMDACLRWEGDGPDKIEHHPIDRLFVKGRVTFEVIEFSLTHMRLGPTAAAYGAVAVDDGDALLVITEDEGGPRATLRSPDGSELELSPGGELLKKD
jgi:hypothetical protein